MVDAKIRVLYGDTDQMGVVYYANYFRYFEFGRSELFRAEGGSYSRFEEEGAFLPVIEATCRYKAPARYDDLLTVRTWVSEVRRASLGFEYLVLRDLNAPPLCTGRTIHACIDKAGKPIRLPPSLARLSRAGAES